MNGPAIQSREVTVIVVTFNSAHCISRLAKGLGEWPYLIVVDNGSDDDTVIQIQQSLPKAKLLALGKNYGFGYANNRGMEAVATPYALLLNPDCEITEAQIHAMTKLAGDWPSLGILGPQLQRESGVPEVNYRMGFTDWPGKTPAATGPLCVGFLCGAVMLTDKAAFDSIGGFDERFFLYYEDDDLCLRMRQAGYTLVLDPSIAIEHRSRGSVKTKNRWEGEFVRGYHHVQSKLTFMTIHMNRERALKSRRKLLLLTGLALPLRMLAFSPRLLVRMWGRWRGLWDWNFQE